MNDVLEELRLYLDNFYKKYDKDIMDKTVITALNKLGHTDYDKLFYELSTMDRRSKGVLISRIRNTVRRCL